MASSSRAQPESQTVILLGEVGVGKTSLANRFFIGDNGPPPVSTAGIQLMSKQVQCGDAAVKLQCWDPAGFERFRRISRCYYRWAAAAVLCYDITSERSFHAVEAWLQEIWDQSSNDILIALVGCKSDLADLRTVDETSALACASKNGCIFMETSAKTNQQVDELFQMIVSRLCKPSYFPSIVFNLSVEKGCGCEVQAALITAANLAGEIVARVKADLDSDDVASLSKSIAEQTGIHPRRQTLVFGERRLSSIDNKSLLATVFEERPQCASASDSGCTLQ